jgi:DNA (cytosine-5)-methyltransferase 1
MIGRADDAGPQGPGWRDDDLAFTQDSRNEADAVAYNWQSGGDVRFNFGLPRLQAHQVPDVGVRRLTPVECERLQGFPDNWTAGQSDAARYRQMGNAVCVNVAEWIAKRIMEVMM